jgi:oligopeptide transport system substrate-binding protein
VRVAREHSGSGSTGGSPVPFGGSPNGSSSGKGACHFLKPRPHPILKRFSAGRRKRQASRLCSPELICGLALLTLLLSSCHRPETNVAKGTRHQIHHKGNGREVQDLDPQIVNSVSASNILSALFEGLVAEDPHDLHPVPGVAERWDISTDGKTYTFHLRADAKWSNGDRVVARDFVESYHRILSPALGSDDAYMLYPVANAEAFNKSKLADFNQVGFRALDDATLEIRLTNPTAYFLSLLNHWSWFPVHLPTIRKYGSAFERGSRWTRPGRFVGNGPFTLDEWRLNDRVRVSKSVTYWDRAHVALNGIVFHTIDSNDVEERAFRSGQLHVTDTIPVNRIDRYRRERPELLRIDPYLGTYFFRANVQRPPLDNRLVRRALAMAIDRQAIVESITRGGQLPAFSFTPPNTASYTCEATLPYDVPAAQKLLSNAGYPDGRGLPPIEILFNTSENHKLIAEAVQQMWQKNLHVAATLLNQEEKVYFDSRRQMNYQVIRSTWIGDYNDPNSFLDIWTNGGGNNQTGWANPEYDRLIGEAGRTADPAARLAAFQRAEAILLDDAPILPVYFFTHAFLVQPSVKGWYPTILDHHPYKYVHLK